MDTTFSMFSAPQSRATQSRMEFPTEPKPRQALTEKYRPKYLADIVGQGAAVMRLMDFADTPYPSAWIFSGPTGTGKTSAALALAAEMRIDRGWGLHWIRSGDCNDEQLTRAVDLLRYVCPAGSGWKMLLIDESDAMSPKAKSRCLSALEDLPDRSMVVLTTNNPEKFDQRFRDRCEMVAFQGTPDLLMLDAQALFNDLWSREGIHGDPFAVSLLPDLTADGSISFRRIVRAVEMIAKGWKPSPGPSQATPTRRRTVMAS